MTVERISKYSSLLTDTDRVGFPNTCGFWDTSERLRKLSPLSAVLLKFEDLKNTIYLCLLSQHRLCVSTQSPFVNRI